MTIALNALPSAAHFDDPERTGLRAEDLIQGITEHLFFTQGCQVHQATPLDFYFALSYAVRDRLMSRHLANKDAQHAQSSKLVAYLSAEFLIGPQLGNNLLMLGVRDAADEALRSFGIESLDRVLDLEEEPGLGNGGLESAMNTVFLIN